MKKKILTTILTGTIAMSMSMTAFAGWEQEGTNWKYNNNGTYAANGWQWIDGNGDGIAECYYFDANGYMLADTTTPDEYYVNADGAWEILFPKHIPLMDLTYPQPTDIPTGYNEYGMSNLALDIMEHTQAENRAKYGVKGKFSSFPNDVIYYGTDFTVRYPSSEGNAKPIFIFGSGFDGTDFSTIFKDPQITGRPSEDVALLQSKGYSAEVAGHSSFNVHCGKYEINLGAIYTTDIMVSIKDGYK